MKNVPPKNLHEFSVTATLTLKAIDAAHARAQAAEVLPPGARIDFVSYWATVFEKVDALRTIHEAETPS